MELAHWNCLHALNLFYLGESQTDLAEVDIQDI
jgi:hypothetical protein